MKVKVKEDHKQRQEEKVLDMRIVAKDYFLYLEESWKYEPTEEKTEENKLWFYEIRGKQGFIYPYNEENLAAVVFWNTEENKVKVTKKVKILLKCDEEMILLFSPKYLDQICKIIMAPKKRKI